MALTEKHISRAAGCRAGPASPASGAMCCSSAEAARRVVYDDHMAHRSLLVFVAAMCLGCAGAPQQHANAPQQVQADDSVARGSAAIAAAMRGSHRSPGAAARDQYRHPIETLAFLGFTPTMTVLDIGPGAGYYTELLAPVLAQDGLYMTTNREPPSAAPAPSGHHWSP